MTVPYTPTPPGHDYDFDALRKEFEDFKNEQTSSFEEFKNHLVEFTMQYINKVLKFTYSAKYMYMYMYMYMYTDWLQ